MITRPMLAEEVKNIDELTWPMIATPKIDGIRCLKIDGKVLSRSFKPIPNHYIRETLEKMLPDGIDGELISANSFQECTSAIMSRDGKPFFTYCVFDFVKDGKIGNPYQVRLADLDEWYGWITEEEKKIIRKLKCVVLNSKDDLLAYEKKMIADGHEGVCLRTPNSPYKCGRSTWKEKWLLKLKVFMDSEAEIIGLEEQVSNQNEKKTNELGLSKRASNKDGMVNNGALGRFLARDLKTGVEFKCGSGKGLTAALRKEIWDNKDSYIGKIFKYKFQPYGVKDLPRLPIWLGFRDVDDMD